MAITEKEIRNLTAAKLTRVVRLLKTRDRLQKRAARINDNVARVLGTAEETKPAPKKARSARRANAHPLSHYMALVLKKAGRPLKAAELARRAIAAGFKTNSKHFQTAIFAVAARNTEMFKRAGRGLFRLVGSGAEAPATKS